MSSKPARSQRPALRNLNPVFHNRGKAEDDQELSASLMKLARKSGILNLAGRGLSTVPDKVYDLNEPDKDANIQLNNLSLEEDEAWWNQVPMTNLDLSSNALTQLSPKIENLFTLTTLTLLDNALTTLPKEIAQLEKLTRINLSRNKIKDLPLEFFTLPELRYLNLSNNCLTELNPAISDLHMLEVLDASNNELVALPGGIGFLVRLVELLLSHNHIKELPPDLVNMRTLRKLDLLHNDLTGLPADIGSLRKLKLLYLQHNDIKELPDFKGCDDLLELHISNNFIEKLDKEFFQNLPHLKVLDLRDNSLSVLPEEISCLQSLNRLDLTNNSLSNLPLSLANCPHLANLQIEGNPIKTIRRDILQCGTSRVLRVLRDRSLAQENFSKEKNCETKELTVADIMAGDGLNSPRNKREGDESGIYPNKYKMRQTRLLNVTKSDLTDVPDDIFETASTEFVNMIDFSRNRLETLPKGLRNMTNCATELIFANNCINTIPIFISQFTRLNLINLSCNRLSDLPKEFGYLNTLRELNISNNCFEKIPSCIYDLGNLEILLARDNRIGYIDASENGLGALKRLATLDLRNNNITHVPPILGNLEQLNSLDIMGNPFRQPRHQIMEKGTDAIMSYLRGRIPA